PRVVILGQVDDAGTQQAGGAILNRLRLPPLGDFRCRRLLSRTQRDEGLALAGLFRRRLGVVLHGVILGDVLFRSLVLCGHARLAVGRLLIIGLGDDRLRGLSCLWLLGGERLW